MDTVRYVDVDVREAGRLRSAIDDLYEDGLDVAVVRRAVSDPVTVQVCSRLDQNSTTLGWARPNQIVPGEDIFLLGSDTPATPTCKAPAGASLEEYLQSGSGSDKALDSLLGSSELGVVMRELIHALGGGRPVEVPVAPDGRRYVPYTLRLLPDGQQISIHHDYHYPISLYSDLSNRVDTATLVSFVLTLQRSTAGGHLVVYALRWNDPNQPFLPNGRWDEAAIETRYPSARFELNAGDFFLLASGRCFHRVERVSGPIPRITFGGFLALDRDHSKILYWS